MLLDFLLSDFIFVVGTMFAQHFWVDHLSDYNSMDKLDSTYGTIRMEQDKAMTT